MARKSITLFMWGFQGSFRRSVEMGLEQSLRVLGIAAEPTVFLIGLLAEGGSRHPLCLEPEDGPIVPADFDGLDEKATELYEQDPDSKLHFSSRWHHEMRHREMRHRAYGTAISEVLEEKLGLRFFVGLPTLVEEHFVFTAVGLPEETLDAAPQLRSGIALDRYPVTQSLLRGAIDETLRLSSRALHDPTAGSGISLGEDPADVAKAAGNALVRSATMLSGYEMPSELFDGLNRVATMRYERRVGNGSLILADAGSEHVIRSVTLREPVPIRETRTLRKLLEISSLRGESLLTDGNEAYGFGRQGEKYPEASESVFKVVVSGDGVWELRHSEVRLVTVRFGAPQLPEQPLGRDWLDEVCSRVFQECDTGALWALARSARNAEHGTMLVISEGAADEATRLKSQALTIEPARLAEEFVGNVTGIDGAVLVDPFGICHAMGVILDGTASSEGDRSRGARYNSAVKYLASAGKETPTVILLVSEDGMINLLPDLRPRMRRVDRDTMLAELRNAAAIQPVHAERFYKAYRRVEANAFYLSPEQIEEVNALRDDHWQRRIAEGATIRVIDSDLRPDPEMSDDYLKD